MLFKRLKSHDTILERENSKLFEIMINKTKKPSPLFCPSEIWTILFIQHNNITYIK